MAQGYLIFHLNLAFSSIKAESRPEVVKRCYWPLLSLAEDSEIPIGIELTGWTLQQIAAIDPTWIAQFRQALKAGHCELIGSGWSQIIGPLIPYRVNQWNQELGLKAYQEMLHARPAVALVNEMAFSSGMVDLYAEAGYRGIVMDRDNVRLALDLNHAPVTATPTHARGCGEATLPVLWSDSILFQRLQRVVHGDIPVSDYIDYVGRRAEQDGTPLPIYCNDAEIFGYRPGRFSTESRLHHEGEWERLRRVLDRLSEDVNLEWISPTQALAEVEQRTESRPAHLTSAAHPIPVKKQPKYNISRWAVTGRDDLWLNTCCHRRAKQLMADEQATADEWRELCELWASDLRTHITDDRWADALRRIDERDDITPPLPATVTDGGYSGTGEIGEMPEGVSVSADEEGILWTVRTPGIDIRLNARRGLAIHSLRFGAHGFSPCVGTLSQGYFATIELGADFYSGGVLVEIPGDRRRVTDLEWVHPVIERAGDWLLVRGQLPMGGSQLIKEVAIHLKEQRVRLDYRFVDFERPLGVVRAGITTLLPDAFAAPFTLSCSNGGPAPETFVLDTHAKHDAAASSLVSSQAGFGATGGTIAVRDAEGNGIAFNWQPDACAVLPMLKHEEHGGQSFTRISFSLCELDETSRPGGRLPPFEMELRPL